MYVILLGSSGQLGGRLLPYLQGWERFDYWAPTRAELDLCDTQSIRKAITDKYPALIINAAAYTNVDKAEVEPELADKVNHLAVREMALAAKDLNIPIIHYSTDYVFDGTSEEKYAEDSPPNPMSVYGRSKLAGDDDILRIAPTGMIFRTSWVYDAVGTNFYTTIRSLCSKQDSIDIVCDQFGVPNSAYSLANCTMRYLWNRQKDVTDLITDCFHIGPVEVTNLASDDYTSWYGFAQLIVSCLRRTTMVRPITTEDYVKKVGDTKKVAERPKYGILNNGKARSNGIYMPKWNEEFIKFVRQPIPTK